MGNSTTSPRQSSHCPTSQLHCNLDNRVYVFQERWILVSLFHKINALSVTKFLYTIRRSPPSCSHYLFHLPKATTTNITSRPINLQRNIRVTSNVVPTPLLCLHSRLSSLLQHKHRQRSPLVYWPPLISLPPSYPRKYFPLRSCSPCNVPPSHYATLPTSIKQHDLLSLHPTRPHHFPESRRS